MYREYKDFLQSGHIDMLKLQKSPNSSSKTLLHYPKYHKVNQYVITAKCTSAESRISNEFVVNSPTDSGEEPKKRSNYE